MFRIFSSGSTTAATATGPNGGSAASSPTATNAVPPPGSHRTPTAVTPANPADAPGLSRQSSSATPTAAGGGPGYSQPPPSNGDTHQPGADANAAAAATGKVLVLTAEYCKVLAGLLQQNRHGEALTLLTRVDLQTRAVKERQRLAVARMIDDELEAAIAHRDAAREFEREASERDVTCEFLRQHVHIRSSPRLVPAFSGGEAVMHPSVAVLLGPSSDIIAVLRNRAKRETLHSTLVHLSQADERVTLTQARSPHEALLAVCLLELCRHAISLCCMRIVDDVSGRTGELGVSPGQQTHQQLQQHKREGSADNGASRSPVLSNASVSNKSFIVPGAAATSDVTTKWEAALLANLAMLRATSHGRAFLRSLHEMLLIARHIVAHKVSEDVQAGTSLLIAELLSVYDRVCQLPPVVRRASPLVCALSGVRLDGLGEAAVERDEHRSFFAPAAALYRECISPTIPQNLS